MACQRPCLLLFRGFLQRTIPVRDCRTNLPLPDPQALPHPYFLLLPSALPSLETASIVSRAVLSERHSSFPNLCARLPYLHPPSLRFAVSRPTPTVLLTAFPFSPLLQGRKPGIVAVSCLPSSYLIVAPSPFRDSEHRAIIVLKNGSTQLAS